MYSIRDYGEMTNDRRRTGAYAAGLQSVITPDSVVLDIGAGPGMLTLLACQAGARRVYAVESEQVIEVARELVALNGFSDRVEFVSGMSTDIDLPEKVDVIVSDVHGVLPFFTAGLKSIVDARDRFLKPGGHMIPAREPLWVGIASDVDYYQRLVGPWENAYGFNLTPGRRRVVNGWTKSAAANSEMLAEPQVWMVLDHATMKGVNGAGVCDFTIEKAGVAHGLVVWFDCETGSGIGFSNAPSTGRESLYQRGFMPLSEAVAVEAGDRVKVSLRADAVGGDYIYRWDTDVRRPSAGNSLVASFQQTDFIGNPVSAEWRNKTGAPFCPKLSDEGKIDGLILNSFASGTSLEATSRQLSTDFPARFSDWRKALTKVGEMSMKYSR